MIKQQRLSDILLLIRSTAFQQWWAEVENCRAERAAGKRKLDDLLSQVALSELKADMSQRSAIETLYGADECADRAASLQLEADELENRSFRAVSDFEEQRFRASEAWYRQGASEKHLEETRELFSKNSGKKAELEHRAAEREYRELAEQYQREMAKKSRLWEEVERIWARSAEVNLLVAEQRTRAKKVRKEAEGLFALAEEAKKKASQLRAEADAASSESEAARARLEAQLASAGEKFECAVGSDFLYFRHKDNQKVVFCISLIEDRENYNVELKPLNVYSTEHQKGVSFLEPAREDSPSSKEGDQRFERYFLGRKAQVSSVGD